jgi:5-methylthioadenosine/S-adenosylhomocysteine deaminase
VRRTVVARVTSTGVDITALTRDLQAAGEHMWANVHKGDWAGRTIDELAPQTFPKWE